MSFEQKISKAWYQDQSWIKYLSPLSKLYEIGLERRRQNAEQSQNKLSVPVVVIGNITVGGTGKTPFIIHLCQKLSEQGLSVGIVSRGYGAKRSAFPHRVDDSDSARSVGDEPLMIFECTGACVVIDPDRYSAAKHLINQRNVDVILSDDGMQHFPLPRDLEILVVDADRELGNELLLPAGPLREPVKRLSTVDFCLLNGNEDKIESKALKPEVDGSFKLKAQYWVNVATGDRVELAELPKAKKTYAVAGIGNPQRFFDTLKSIGLDAECHALDDHQSMSRDLLVALGANSLAGGLTEADNLNRQSVNQILMTTKDAVKCRSYASENCWALSVGVEIDEAVEQRLLSAIQSKISK